MKFSKLLIASAALVAVMGANAQVTGALGGGYGTFLALSGPSGATCTALTCTLGPGVATIVGGQTYLANDPTNNARPFGTNAVSGNFLSAGPTASEPSVMTFLNGGVDYISFLWGSPDIYNVLTVTSTGGAPQSFSAAGLGFAVTDGNQTFSQYVQFTASAGSKITSFSYSNVPATDAFETANYSITPIPEPQTYALLLAGLGAVGFVARRRNK